MVVPPTPSASAVLRDELRFKLRKRRKSIEIKEISLKIPHALQVHLEAASSIGSYSPIGSEMLPSPIDQWCVSNNKALFFPWFKSQSSEMVFRLFAVDAPMMTGPFNFQQLPESAPEAVPDLLIIPLLGFDRSLNRIGQGKGHYDRYLAKYPQIIRIGLAHSCQEVDQLPTEPWDMPLHAVVTEREWIEGTK